MKIGDDTLDFRQLEAYINVFELKSFSKASQKMFLSQPSISAYVNALEKELQTQLIHRSTKEFIPTKSGILFYQYARDMLSLRNNSIHSLKNLSDANVGSIEILASSVPAQYILPEIFGRFHKLYPNVLFNMEQADSTEVVNAISSYQCEIGFVGAKIDTQKCVYREFMSEKLIVIAPYEEKFRNIDPENVTDFLYHEYFIMREAGSGTRLRYEQYLESIGFNLNKLKVCAQLNNTHSIIHSVANGLGVSIVSELAARQYIEQKKILPIYTGHQSERSFYIVLKNNRIHTPIIDTFVEYVCDFCQDQSAFNRI